MTVGLNSSLHWAVLKRSPFHPSIVLCLGLLAAEGAEIQSFTSPMDRTGDLWHCVGLSSLLRDLGALKTLVKDAAQVAL